MALWFPLGENFLITWEAWSVALVLAIAGIPIGIYIFQWGLRRLFFKRMIEDIPTSKIRSVAMGPVEVYGKVIPQKTMKSQISRIDCVYCKFKVERCNEAFPGPGSTWTEVDSFNQSEPFYIRDETGSALVNTAGAKIDIKPNIFISDSEVEKPKGADDLINMYKVRSIGELSGTKNPLRFTECIIEPNQNLFILGTAKPNIPEHNNSKVKEILVIGMGENGLFYISDKPEKSTLSKLGWKVKASIIGGIVIIPFSLLIIVSFS